MPTDLDDRLAAYGDRLRTGAAPIELDEVVEHASVVDAHSAVPRSGRRRLVAAAAAALVVVSLVGAWAVADRARIAPAGQVDATPTSVASPVDVTAFGESVMLGASRELQAAGVTVDAAENRQARDMVAVIRDAAANGRLGDTVVVQVGTNGTVTAEQLDEIVAAVGDRQLYLLTVKADMPWIAGNDERIRALPSGHPNVHVIDWQQRSTEIAGELSVSDGGTHLRTRRAMQFYANMILDAIGRPDRTQPLPG